MKKIVSIKALRKYLERHPYSYILYRTMDQPWYRTTDTCRIDMVCPTMLTFINPNHVCLKLMGCDVLFRHVRTAEIDTESMAPETVITLHCKNYSDEKKDDVYTLIAK